MVRKELFDTACAEVCDTLARTQSPILNQHDQRFAAEAAVTRAVNEARKLHASQAGFKVNNPGYEEDNRLVQITRLTTLFTKIGVSGETARAITSDIVAVNDPYQ